MCVIPASQAWNGFFHIQLNNKQTEKATHLFQTSLKPFNVYSESIPNAAGKRIQTEW